MICFFRLSLFLICLLAVFPAYAATIYVDNSMGADCTSGNYSIASRNCTGSNGNAWNTLQEGENNASTNDTINVRAGTFTENMTGTDGVNLKNGQVWQAYNNETVTLNLDETQAFLCNGGAHSWTIRGFTITGTRRHGIRVGQTTSECGTGFLIENNIVTGWGDEDLGCVTNGFWHGISIHRAPGGIVRNNYVHTPAAQCDNLGGIVNTNGPFPGGSGSNNLIERNRIHNTPRGLWSDVDGGNPDRGLTPHTWRYNWVSNTSRQGARIEARSSIKIHHNIFNNCPNTASQHCIDYRLGGAMKQNELYNNSVIRGTVGGGSTLRIGDAPGDTFTNAIIRNNVFENADEDVTWLIEDNVPHASNVIEDDHIFVSHAANDAICWNQPATSGSFNCQTGSGATLYKETSGDMAQFLTDTGHGTGNTIGDPNWNPGSDDFNLPAGSPAAGVATDGGDKGALQSPTVTSCVAVDANTVNVNFAVMASYQPISQATTANFAVRGSTTCASNCTETGTAINGNTQVAVTVSNTLVGGETIDVALPNADAVRDSACIGGSKAPGGCLNSIARAMTTPVTCTNNISGGGGLTLTQTEGQFYGANRAEGVSPRGAKSANRSAAPGDFFLWRVCIQASGGNAPATAYKPQARLNGGTWTTITNTCGSDPGICFYDDLVRLSGTTLTDQGICTGTFLAGQFIDSAGASPSIAINSGQKLAQEYGLQLWSGLTPVTDSIELRMVQDSGAVLDTYTYMPTITVREPFVFQ